MGTQEQSPYKVGRRLVAQEAVLLSRLVQETPAPEAMQHLLLVESLALVGAAAEFWLQVVTAIQVVPLTLLQASRNPVVVAVSDCRLHLEVPAVGYDCWRAAVRARRQEQVALR